MKEKITNILIRLINGWCSIFVFPYRLVRKKDRRGNIVEKFYIAVCEKLDKYSRFYPSFCIRPKMALMNSVKVGCESYKDIAIILQGPIDINDNFTLETVKYYHSMCQDAYIILSTWDYEDVNYYEKFHDIQNVYIVTCKLPEKPGIFNLNYQIASTKAGIKKAQDLGAKYICKTRTDQRLQKANSLIMMKHLLDMFPSELEQEKRMVCLGAESSGAVTPYYIEDFFAFSTTREIIKLFDVPFDEQNISRKDRFTRRDLAEQNLFPEGIIHKNYLQKCGIEPITSVKRYWECIKKGYILFDRYEIGLYWHKYKYRYCDHLASGMYSTLSDPVYSFNFDFSTWAELYYGELKYDKKFELQLNKLL